MTNKSRVVAAIATVAARAPWRGHRGLEMGVLFYKMWVSEVRCEKGSWFFVVPPLPEGELRNRNAEKYTDQCLFCSGITSAHLEVKHKPRNWVCFLPRVTAIAVATILF